MTLREKLLAALDRKPIKGLVPHFELEFFLTMEAFGRLHPAHRHFSQWNQMSEGERELHRKDIADLYVTILNRFGLSSINFPWPHGWAENDIRKSIDHVRKLDGLPDIV